MTEALQASGDKEQKTSDETVTTAASPPNQLHVDYPKLDPFRRWRYVHIFIELNMHIVRIYNVNLTSVFILLLWK